MTENEAQSGDDEVGICHVCGQSFPTQRALSQHLMEVHPEDVLPSIVVADSPDEVGPWR